MGLQLYRLPLPARALAAGLLAYVIAYAVFGLWPMWDTFSERPSWHHVAAVGCALGGFVATILGDRLIRRDFGSMEQYRSFAQALRTGELPAEIGTDIWRRWLDATHDSTRYTLALPFIFGIYGVMRYFTYDREALGPSIPFAVLAIVFLASWWVRHRRIARLAAAIDQRDAMGG